MPDTRNGTPNEMKGVQCISGRHVQAFTYTHTYISTYIHTYMHMLMHMHIHMHTCTHAYIHTCCCVSMDKDCNETIYTVLTHGSTVIVTLESVL